MINKQTIKGIMAPLTVFLIAFAMLIGCTTEEVTCECEGAICYAGGNRPPSNAGDLNPEPTSAVVDNIVITHLSVENDLSQPLKVNHPIELKIGLTGTAEEPFIPGIIIGLIEQVPADAADDSTYVTEATICVIGSVSTEIAGDGTELMIKRRLLIPPECLAEGKVLADYNLWATVDYMNLLKETAEGAEEDNTGFYNEREIERGVNQLCLTATNETESDPITGELVQKKAPGCVVDLRVVPSDGPGIEFTDMVLESSVGVIWAPATDVTVGAEEYYFPNIKVDAEVTGFGILEGNVIENPKSNPAIINYWIRPANKSTGWALVRIFNKSKANSPTGHKYRHAVRDLAPGTPELISHDLYFEGNTLDLIQGAWADESNFTLRGCINFKNTVDSDDPGDNCIEKSIVLVEETKPAAQANSYSFNRDWSAFYGSSSTVGLGLGAYTHNLLNLSGASTDNSATSYVDGLLGYIPIIDLWARSAAYFSVADSYIDLGVDLLGQTLWSYYYKADVITYSYDKIYAKTLGKTFVYVIYIVPLVVEIGVTGEGGLKNSITLTATEETPSQPKKGVLNPNSTPYASFYGSVNGYTIITLARAGAYGYINFFTIEYPLNGYLLWQMQNFNPFQMGIETIITWDQVITTLDGYVELYADYYGADVCWAWYVPYPCNWGWRRIASYELARWAGYSYTTNLLYRSASYTLQ